ncbi:hypothetical protein PENSPDRAFT_679890 [Peniophora sp. CONT]|nr:hypothetical protein PENSPDRAFT_679890 [Peniophora sp. CONT]
MSSPPLSRSSSPSLESVSDFSDDGSAPHVLPTDDAPAINLVPSVSVDSSVSDGESAVNPQPGNLVTSDRVETVHEVDNAAEAQLADSERKVPTVGIPANWESPDARHERYFFTDESLTFSVEGTTYRVHSAFFTRSSSYWAEQLAKPGRSTRPICLVGMRKNEVDAFLSTLYSTPDLEVKSRTLEDWEAILRLAHWWKFEEQRKLAIAALEPLVSPFEKLRAARKYDIEAWLYSAFVELCLRPTTLTLEEAKCLPLRDVMHVMSAREALYKGRTGSPSREDVSAYVAKHIHAPATPIAAARGPSAPQTPAQPPM